jgi:hypothetical protein
MAELLQEGARLRAEQEQRRRQAAEAAAGKHKKVSMPAPSQCLTPPGGQGEGFHDCMPLRCLLLHASQAKKEKKKKEKDKKAKV